MTIRADLTVPEIVELLAHLDYQERKQVIFDLLAAGVDPQKIITVVRDLSRQHDLRVQRNLRVIWWTFAVAMGSLSAFHGYRRNRNVGWSLAWFAAGTILPFPTIVIALAQGYAQPKRLKNDQRRRRRSPLTAGRSFAARG